MAPSAIRQRIYENYATTGVSPLLYVPDASVAIKWFLREAVAPDLLRLEIAHVLRKKTHSGLDIAEALETWKDLNAVPIEWVPVQPLLDAILIEALARKVSVYDMTYLDVARRHKAVVVTADDGLAPNGARENLAIHVRDYHP